MSYESSLIIKAYKCNDKNIQIITFSNFQHNLRGVLKLYRVIFHERDCDSDTYKLIHQVRI